MNRNVMAPSVAKAMNDLQVVERLQMLEELAERVVANQTDLTSLMRSQQANGVLYSGMVATQDDGTGNGVVLLDFAVPYAAVYTFCYVGGTEWYAANFQTVGVPNTTSPGGTFAGLVHTTRSALAFHLAGQRLQLTSVATSASFYVAVYSDPRMIIPG